MTRSMFRFLSRQPEGPLLYGDAHLLRLARHGDYGQWHSLRSESRGFLQPWEPRWRDDELTAPSFRARVDRGVDEHRAGHSVPLLLFERPGMTLLGGLTIGYIRRGAAQSCMIGYWMGERHAGQGHMESALKIAIPYIYGQLQLHRIEAACIPENWKSVRLLEKTGFEREGLLRQYLKINGEWRDHVMFSRLPEDGEFGKMMRP
ncbi:GNAT family N-acetyltransferase [Pseudorhizobium pelagicum]|uniref:GCN5 family acetyltransferase n=1 Tax=Pseudorhizobium pelagicum TaxID=1509405 RepID=A0A922P251_9HYPH|nr:GNAT family N-acetyltransferase [Pseudorhizobium pelagicum]KEQ09178.1 GCN5 family acetyltransferase [Pseudorhizobium pelagicum]KEQ11002.1 GCN5 family acetyltransferase [Pseudorhizobium pelagicum]MDY6961180.1 GNAT family N-acetyltransferase [Pseudomonadota bacterium]